MSQVLHAAFVCVKGPSVTLMDRTRCPGHLLGHSEPNNRMNNVHAEAKAVPHETSLCTTKIYSLTLSLARASHPTSLAPSILRTSITISLIQRCHIPASESATGKVSLGGRRQDALSTYAWMRTLPCS